MIYNNNSEINSVVNDINSSYNDHRKQLPADISKFMRLGDTSDKRFSIPNSLFPRQNFSKEIEVYD